MEHKWKWCHQLRPFSKAWWTCEWINVCVPDRWREKTLWCNPQRSWPACRERNRAEATRGFGSRPRGPFVPSPSQPVFPSLLWSILASNHWRQHASPPFLLSLLLLLKPSLFTTVQITVTRFVWLGSHLRTFVTEHLSADFGHTRMRQQAHTRLLKCVQQDKTTSLKKQLLINPEHINASPYFRGFIPVI